MNLYRNLVFPLLRQTDPERAHERASRALALAARLAPGRAVLRAVAGRLPGRAVELWGVRFPNVLGVAAGFDKDVHTAAGLGLLGFGHVEVGTLTPRPQPGNPRPRVFRLPEREAVINRMGFPNGGVAAALPRLAALGGPERGFVVGVSLGKQKETPLEAAAGDYIEVMRAVYPYADYLAINISSPNTPGLRELQGEAYLARLLGDVVRERDALAAAAGRRRPLLVKFAPDLTDAELDAMLEATLGAGIDGVIATNTTLDRAAVAGLKHAGEIGGLSGRPLTAASTRLVARIVERTGGRIPVIGVGGVFTAEDARAKLDAGAALVQIYTGIVYEGPGIVGRILRGLER